MAYVGYFQVPLNAPYTTTAPGPPYAPAETPYSGVSRILPVPYPPGEYLMGSSLYLTLLIWSIPNLIIPQVVGSLISFKPDGEVQQGPDALTAAITRIACVIAGDWGLGDWRQHLGITQKWRLLGASVAGAFALAEAIGERKKLATAPTQDEHPNPALAIEDGF